MNPFLDSTVLVDLLRQYPPAVTWLQRQSALNITPVVWMEMIIGAPNRIGQQQAVRLMSQFVLVHVTTPDIEWAMQRLLKYRLSHGTGMNDCLIASICHRLQVPLYTHNRKHIEPVLGTALTIKPY